MRLIDEDALMSAVMAQEVVDKSVAKRLIIQAPTVDAVPVKQGRWIKCTHRHWEDRYECSKCGYDTEVDTLMEKPIYNFCPYCGARMDGEGREE